MIAPTLNGIPCSRIKFTIPWTGVWCADVELNPDDPSLAPSMGPATIVLGSEDSPQTLLGVVSPIFSGTFAQRSFVRVVGGYGGWSMTLPPQQFYNPAGLTSTLVYAATSAAIGEVVVDTSPIALGANYARVAGPASNIFGDREWHVDPTTGVTTTAPWAPIPTLLDGTSLVDFDPTQNVARLQSQALVLPGTVLTDDRLGQSYTIRDVEQEYTSAGSTVTAWCGSDATSRLRGAFANAVRSAIRFIYLQRYVYRFESGISGKMTLAAVTPGAPDLNPIDQWSGMSGLQGKLALGTLIIVGFAGADPSQPYVESYSPIGVPPEVDIAGGANYLTPAPWAIALTSALSIFAGACAASVTDPVLSAAATTLQTTLATLPPSATILTRAT